MPHAKNNSADVIACARFLEAKFVERDYWLNRGQKSGGGVVGAWWRRLQMGSTYFMPG
jgi:hypothetical protein